MNNLKTYFTNIKLKGKFIGFSLILTVATVMIIVATSIQGSKKALEKKIISGISNTANLKAERINEFYSHSTSSLEFISSQKLIQNYSYKSNKESENQIFTLINDFKKHNEFYRINLLDINKSIIVSTDNSVISKQLHPNLIKSIDRAQTELSNSKIYKENELFLISFTKPILDSSERIKGYISIDIDMQPVYSFIQDAQGLGETGETLLGMETENGALFLNPLRHDKSAALTRKATFGNEAAKPILEATQGKSGEGILYDYRKKEAIAVWRYIPSFNWGIVAKIDVDEAFEPIAELRFKLILIAFIITLVGILLAIRFAVVITGPINNLKNAMKVISEGNVLSDKVKKNSDDEVGEMVDQANNLVDFQKNIIEFTQEIGKGNFSFESKHDISKGDLGKELIKMKNSLEEVSHDEKKRNWVTEGQAKFASILRENNDDLEILTDNIITNLVKYLEANQGGIFILSDDRKNPKMELKSAYAYDRKKFLEKQFELGEGLIGQCWQEKEKIFLTDIPQEYINITSGLGTTNPTCILIVPLTVNEEIYGIMELASFKVFDEYDIDLIEKLATSIASTLNSVKVNLHTTSLLEEAQQMSEELQAQEEELRQNAEEMQATQEEMERAQKELVKKEAGLRAIIDNSEDTIFAINTNYEITVVNSKLLNKYKNVGIDLSPGNNIIDILPKDKQQFWKDRYDKALNGEKFETIDDLGNDTKASVSHYPMYNEAGEITGVAVVSRELKP